MGAAGRVELPFYGYEPFVLPLYYAAMICNDNPAFVAKYNDKCSDNTIAFFTAKKCARSTLFTTNKDIGADDGNRTR